MLKITAVRTTPIRAPLDYPYWSATQGGLDQRLAVSTSRSILLVEIETNEGLVGLGQCISAGRNLKVLDTLIQEGAGRLPDRPGCPGARAPSGMRSTGHLPARPQRQHDRGAQRTRHRSLGPGRPGAQRADLPVARLGAGLDARSTAAPAFTPRARAIGSWPPRSRGWLPRVSGRSR